MIRNCAVQKVPLLILFLFFVAMISVGLIPGKANALSKHVNDKLLHFSTYAVMTVFAFFLSMRLLHRASWLVLHSLEAWV